jgi:hypothetical protein
MLFETLTDEEEKELHRLSRVYWREALLCEKTGAYLAGCTMLGSCLENILILMINAHSEDVESTGKVPHLKSKPKALLNWTFAELLRVAKSAGWLPSAPDLKDGWSGRKAKIGDYAEVVRMVRNLVHPARYLKDFCRKELTKKYLQQQFDVVSLCCEWLAERNSKSLLKHYEGVS